MSRSGHRDRGRSGYSASVAYELENKFGPTSTPKGSMKPSQSQTTWMVPVAWLYVALRQPRLEWRGTSTYSPGITVTFVGGGGAGEVGDPVTSGCG